MGSAQVVNVADEYFRRGMDAPAAYACATLSFFAGVALMALIHTVVHNVFHRVARGGATALPDSPRDGSSTRDEEMFGGDDDAAAILQVSRIAERRRLLAMAAVISTAIVLHNIPEGMATYVASFHSVSAGLPLAIAIAIHNIPEGLAVAMPIYHGTGSRKNAVILGTMSGLSEPFGALLASLVANEHSSTSAFGGMFGLTAGMMVYVCVSELLPAAFAERQNEDSRPESVKLERCCGNHKAAMTCAFFFGCAVMALSLVVEKIAAG